MVAKIPPPFPYFGGKSRIADAVWQRFGEVTNYVEPFAGSLAVFLAAPSPPKLVTLNDIDGFISNFWRSVKHDPDGVASFADWPVNEIDLFARHVWLVARKGELTEKLMADPDYYDVKIAGWWVWGICSWFANGWCSGVGSWTVEDGRVVKTKDNQGVIRRQPCLGTSGKGVHRKSPYLSHSGHGVHRQLAHLSDNRGIHRGIFGAIDSDCEAKTASLRAYMRDLADRLRFARITCGDFERVLGRNVTYLHGLTAIFLDPPYSEGRSEGVYACDSFEVAHRARDWCRANGNNPLLRIALCGYEGEHNELESLGWSKLAWKTKGGYGVIGQGRGRENRHKERIWFSPHCLAPLKRCDSQSLFELLEEEGGSYETACGS